MKQVTFMFAVCLLCHISGCKPGTETASAPAAPESSEKIEYAYQIDHPADNWTPGDQKHVATCLNSLKAFENNDMTAFASQMGDSVQIRFDGFERKFSRDSLTAFFATERKKMKSLTVHMDDWESVISKDKKVEYVSLWYKQVFTDPAGKIDSTECMNDFKMLHGKIIEINEKIRHFAAK